MTNGYNQIPAQCQGLCELTQAQVDRHEIILTRNCDGPTPSEGEVDHTAVVVAGEVTEIDATVKETTGRIACRNAGFNSWLSAKETQFKEGLA